MPMLMSWLAGVCFGLGLAVSGMTDPLKVQNFLDVSGAWDPSLALVMGGAVVVTFLGYRMAWRRAAPWLAVTRRKSLLSTTTPADRLASTRSR